MKEPAQYYNRPGWRPIEPSYAHASPTAQEINFIRGLHERNQESYRKYANIILTGMRRYDRDVKVWDVLMFIRTLEADDCRTDFSVYVHMASRRASLVADK